MADSATPRIADTVSTPVVAVAFSGGLDSTALLHVTAVAALQQGVRVVALHVHHGLQDAADAWAEHCKAQADSFHVDFRAERLSGAPAPGDSIEAWAREGRHAALQRMAKEAGADLLLLAHHRRDQAETWLLQVMRGAGIAGQAAMPRMVWRDGVCWARPWLDESRANVQAYALAHGLNWIDDPSNADPRFARNRLRMNFWPAFPQADEALVQAANWAQQALDLVREVAAQDLSSLVSGGRLDLPGLLALSPARSSNALREWLRSRLSQPAPATLVTRVLTQWRRGATLSWPAPPGWLHAYRDGLFWQPAGAPTGCRSSQTLDLSRPGRYPQPPWRGAWRVESADRGGVPWELLTKLTQVARHGAEQFQAAPDRPARSLKKAFQEAGVAPWLRDGPLLFAEGRLLAVAALGLDARCLAAAGTAQARLVWEEWPEADLPQGEGQVTPPE